MSRSQLKKNHLTTNKLDFQPTKSIINILDFIKIITEDQKPESKIV